MLQMKYAAQKNILYKIEKYVMNLDSGSILPLYSKSTCKSHAFCPFGILYSFVVSETEFLV